jgi:hypothetical protein
VVCVGAICLVRCLILKMSETNQKKRVESQVTSNSENPTLQISTVKLDGLNYLSWSQSALLYIKSRGKRGHLNGKIQELKPEDPTYDKWEPKKFYHYVIVVAFNAIGDQSGLLVSSTTKEV